MVQAIWWHCPLSSPLGHQPLLLEYPLSLFSTLIWVTDTHGLLCPSFLPFSFLLSSANRRHQQERGKGISPSIFPSNHLGLATSLYISSQTFRFSCSRNHTFFLPRSNGWAFPLLVPGKNSLFFVISFNTFKEEYFKNDISNLAPFYFQKTLKSSQSTFSDFWN